MPKKVTMRQGKFSLDESPAYAGWTTGELWNGFATPSFEKAEADKIAEFILLQGDHESVVFDYKKDEYRFVLKAEVTGGSKADRTETFDGFDAVNGKHLYSIGGYAWTWWEITLSELTKPRDMKTAHDVESFLRACVDFFGLGFHPDTAGADYQEFESNKPTFTAAQAKAFDKNMERAFVAAENLHIDLYAIGNELFSKQAS